MNVNKLFKIILKDVKHNKSVYISLIAVVIIGLVFGSLFITILSHDDKTLLTSEISTYFNMIKDNKYNMNAYLFSNFNNILYAFILWILGISVIGLPIIICMLFYKIFTLAFTVTSLIYHFKIEGMLISFIYIFPHLIINLIIYFILTYYSFNMSLKIIRVIFNKEDFSVKRHFKKYAFILAISIVMLVITASYEAYIMPYIIKLIY
mgnify:FL=1